MKGTTLQSIFEYKQIENFEFILESEAHSVKSTELIEILSSSRKLIQGINITLNKKYAAGYDFVDFDVLAFEEGSFRIPISIKKFSNSVASNALGNLISGLFLLGITNSLISIFSNEEEVKIPIEVLMEHHDTKSAVVNIAKTAVQSDSIKGISLNYLKHDGSMEKISIEKEQLVPLASINTDIIPEKAVSNVTTKLLIISPVLDGKKVNWKFKNMKGYSMTAKMDDDVFLSKMDEEHIAFGPNDLLTVQLETTVVINEDGQPSTSHIIKKVIDYPHYHRETVERQVTIDFDK